MITADEGLRGGKQVPLKANVDEALSKPAPTTVENVLVVQRTGARGRRCSDRATAGTTSWSTASPTTCAPER